MGAVIIVSFIKLFRIGPFTASYESSFITSLIKIFHIGSVTGSGGSRNYYVINQVILYWPSYSFKWN